MIEFVMESWKIEGLTISYTEAQRFLEMHRELDPDVAGLTMMAAQFTDGVGVLRNKRGRDVQVGKHVPIKGGPRVEELLDLLLRDADYISPYELHHRFETLHPFMDGNGRVGRSLWLWRMHFSAPLGFLHHWYYQSLDVGR